MNKGTMCGNYISTQRNGLWENHRYSLGRVNALYLDIKSAEGNAKTGFRRYRGELKSHPSHPYMIPYMDREMGK